MTPDEFRRRWESSDDRDVITFDDVARCAQAWGLLPEPRTHPVAEVVRRVLDHAGMTETTDKAPSIRWSDETETIDHDEYGNPVRDEYRRLGASGRQGGLYVRFEPGFGLNVHIGHRIPRYDTRRGASSTVFGDVTDKEFRTGIDGWERLCELVDEWRERGGDNGRSTQEETT